MVGRDRELEKRVIAKAGGIPSYGERVLARLDEFEHNDGGNVGGWEKSLDELAVEAQEEASDITGWLVGAFLRLPPERRGRLIRAVQFAAAAHRELEMFRMELARGELADQ